MNRSINLIYCLTFILVLWALPSHAQYMAKRLGNSDGLSNNSVNCFFEDSEQTLWIGTWDGLNTYDGRRLRTYRYDKNTTGSISNNVIRQIVEQDGEHIWVSTNYGISRWNRSTQTFDNFSPGNVPGSLKGMSAPYLVAIVDGRVIVCVKRTGFYVFDDATGRFVAINDAPDPNVQYMLADRYGYLYILTEARDLYRWRIAASGDGVIFADSDNLCPGEQVRDITLSDDILLATHSSSVSAIDTADGRISVFDMKQPIESKAVYSKGGIFANTSSSGFIRHDMRNRRSAVIDMIPVGLSVFSLYAGSQDIIWIGTDGQGFYQLYEYTSPFRAVKIDYPVRSFSEHDDGTILVGTKGGGIKMLNRRDGSITGILSTSGGLISNAVYSMRKNAYGDIFIGTEGEGINYILRNETTVRRLYIPGGSPACKSVYSINFTQGDSVLWAGTATNGLIRIDIERNSDRYVASRIVQYSSSGMSGSLSSNTIYSIVRGDDGKSLWLGTRGGGVDIFHADTGIFERLESLGSGLSISHNDVLSMLKGNSGYLWIGTGYGLNRVAMGKDGIEIRDYTDSDGLANNTIHGVIEDTGGNVWVSTNHGISFIDTTSGEVTNYTSRNGLQDNEFSDGAYFMDSRNTIWFGGVGGLNYFNAEDMSLRSYSPGISLGQLKINDEKRNIHERIKDNTLRLGYDEPYVNLSFVVRDFINNENCVYSYRITGFADQWIYNGNNPDIVITKLPPGKYRLEVRYTNSDRVWSEGIYTLGIIADYPWWQSWWAYLMYAALALGGAATAYVIIRNRMKLKQRLLLENISKKNQQRIHESRLNFFTNVAHEFFTPLTLIYGPAQQLLEKGALDDYAKHYVTMIKNNADRMQNLLSELMDFRKAESGHTPMHPEKVEVQLLIDYISDNYSEIAGQNKINFRIEAQNLSSVVTDRNALEKITFNLISNAFKYTPKNGYVIVRVSQSEDYTLLFSVINSGKGLTEIQRAEVFDRFKIFESVKREGAISTGLGLNLTKGLAELLGGRISVDSVPGENVEFRVELPSLKLPHDLPDSSPEAETAINIIPAAKRKEVSILIVDDERNIRELLRDILSPYYDICEASDGHEALDIIARNRPDIIITDIVMPGMDGFGLIETLHANDDTAHIPVISISAKSNVEDRITAYERGTDVYITKPFHPRQVIAAVENIISKHSVLKKYYTSSRSSVTVRSGKKMHHDDERLLREIIAYIEKNIDDESLNPTSISEFTGISKASLYQKLKDLTGRTPGEYVRIIRLEHASRLLLTTQYTVSEIMYKSGFSSKSYFYKEFSKQYGVSPKEFRKQPQTNN